MPIILQLNLRRAQQLKHQFQSILFAFSIAFNDGRVPHYHLGQEQEKQEYLQLDNVF